MSTFFEFALPTPLVNAAKKLGYINPSDVQSKIIPQALQGKSLVCQAETGSGKTHAYLLPLLAKTDMHLNRLQSIIVCPSRELARQVYDFAFAFTKFFPSFKVRLFTSEVEVSQNKEGSSIAPMMAIGTPGRLKEMLSTSYSFDLHGVKTLVLDEADMLLELGYFEDIDDITSKLSDSVQTMVFSATMNEGLKQRLEGYIGSEFLFEGEKNKTSSRVSHHFLDIKHVGNGEALLKFLKIRRPYFCLVFASKKETVKETADFLKNAGIEAAFFSGDLDQRGRKQALRAIRANKYAVVVCSDLLARGIDLEDVSDVVSLDLPSDLSYYFHRAGRTGRFDKEGDSWIFYNSDSLARAKELSSSLNYDCLTLKGEEIVEDPIGLAKKKKLTAKKKFDEEERKAIKIAKAETRPGKVKPAYKKKQKMAVEKVKNKYRRKAIQKSIKAKKDARYAERAKRKLEAARAIKKD